MNTRDPQEFIYRRIKLAPLIEAAKSGDWKHVKSLLDNKGYSLLWIDSKLKLSTVSLIKEVASPQLMQQLIEYSSQLHGATSDAHQFVLAEAAKDPIKAAALAQDAKADTNPDNYAYPISYSSIFYLYRKGDVDSARNQVRRLWDKLQFDKIPDAINAYMRAAALKGVTDLSDSVATIRAQLAAPEWEEYDALITGVAIAEAAAVGYEDWATKQLQILISNNAPNIQQVLGAAVVYAASRGQADLIFKLCDCAKQARVDKSDWFMNSLALATGAALVKEHYTLTKVLMQMVPHFQAGKLELKELQSWPAAKVERMVKFIGDNAISQDIIREARLNKPVSLGEEKPRSEQPLATPAEERCCLQSKKEIAKFLTKNMTGAHFKATKGSAQALQENLVKIVNMKDLKEYLSNQPRSRLVDKCLEIIATNEQKDLKLQKGQ